MFYFLSLLKVDNALACYSYMQKFYNIYKLKNYLSEIETSVNFICSSYPKMYFKQTTYCKIKSLIYAKTVYGMPTHFYLNVRLLSDIHFPHSLKKKKKKICKPALIK